MEKDKIEEIVESYLERRIDIALKLNILRLIFIGILSTTVGLISGIVVGVMIAISFF